MRSRQFVPPLEGLCFGKPKRTAQIDDPEASVQELWSDFSRHFMRCGKKGHARAALGNRIHRPSANRRLAPAAKLRQKLGEAVRALGFANIKCQRTCFRMAQ